MLEDVPFSNGMRIVVPFPSPCHGAFLQAAADGAGLPWVFISDADGDMVAESLTVVNNDACYSTQLVVGQVLKGVRTVESQEDIADCENAEGASGLAVALPWFCRGCRGIDQPFFISKALRSLGLPHVDTIPFFEAVAEIPESAQARLAASLMMADGLFQAWTAVSSKLCAGFDEAHSLKSLIEDRARESMGMLRGESVPDAVSFISKLSEDVRGASKDALRVRPAVGLAGSVPALFSPELNNRLVDVLEDEGCSVVVPCVSALALHALREVSDEHHFRNQLEVLLDDLCAQKTSFCAFKMSRAAVNAAQPRFISGHVYRGSGWMLSEWMAQLLDAGISNIVYVSLFGCMSGHVSGAGALNRLRKAYPNANIASVEYDSGTSEMNQLNRLKLMASIAWQRWEDERDG